ncbi:MAG TPA: glycosyltransferase family 2 protein [Rugosimonospora sp.]|nr:glycosyltransferase family 2 protein [Rugosimonospora sp.]
MQAALPSVSVVICAYTEDRWPQLCGAVESLHGQVPAPAEVLLVIDHNDPLRARAARAFPGCRVLANRGPRGLSGARNTGVAVASGDIVAFLDDDATARDGWLAGMLRWFADPDIVGVSGRVEPVWPRRRPAWFPAEFDWVVGCSYTGLPERPAPVRNPIGSSMSFRRVAMRSIDGFRDGVGRTGTVPLGCEETEFAIRLGRAYPGRRVIYDPGILADHWVSPDRAAWSYFRARCWAEGLSKAAVQALVGADDALRSERRYLLRVLPAAVLHGLARPGPGWGRAAAVLTGLGYTGAGYLVGLWRQRRRPPGRLVRVAEEA